MSDKPNDAGWRLYLLLALIDRRDGTWLAEAVQAAREGYERAHMGESGAWEDFDRLWAGLSSEDRLGLAHAALDRN